MGLNIPTTEINGEKWLLLKCLDRKILFRADSIEIKGKRVSDPSGHRMDEAIAEGSVKCKPRSWDLTNFK